MFLRLSAFFRKPISIENHHFSRITAHHKLTTVQLSLQFSVSLHPVTVYGTETEKFLWPLWDRPGVHGSDRT